MTEESVPELILVSGACCAPHLAKLDQALWQNVEQALDQLDREVEIKRVSLSGLLGGGEPVTTKQREQILALFQKYGVTFTPALMINGQMRFASKVPTPEQIKEAVLKAVIPQG